MKKRIGFVSNSSSSSFIVGIGKIIDKEKFENYLKSHDFGEYNKQSCFVSTVAELANQSREDYNPANYFNGQLVLSSFSSRVELVDPLLQLTDHIVAVDIVNNEGDTGYFAYNYMNGGIDYDIDLDYFDERQQMMYSMFSDPESGIDVNTSRCQFGAARNG